MRAPQAGFATFLKIPPAITPNIARGELLNDNRQEIHKALCEAAFLTIKMGTVMLLADRRQPEHLPYRDLIIHSDRTLGQLKAISEICDSGYRTIRIQNTQDARVAH